MRIILLVLFSISSFCHYLVMENHEGNLKNPSEKDFYQAYDIINSYAWPMITAFTNNLQKLYQNNLNNQENIELSFIDSEIKKINPKLEVEYMPDILYDLATLYLYDQIAFPQFGRIKFDFDEELFAKNEDIKRLCFKKNDERELEECKNAGIEIYKKINFEETIKKLSYTINQELLQMVSNAESKFDDYIVDSVINKFEKFNDIYGSYELIDSLAKYVEDFYPEVVSNINDMGNIDERKLNNLPHFFAKFKKLKGELSDFIIFLTKLGSEKNFEKTLYENVEAYSSDSSIVKFLAEAKDLAGKIADIPLVLQEIDFTLVKLSYPNENTSEIVIGNYKKSLLVLAEKMKNIFSLFNQANDNQIKQLYKIRKELSTNEMIQKIKIYFDAARLYKISRHFRAKDFKELMFTGAELEKKAFEKNKTLLYRGSSGFMVSKNNEYQPSNVPDSAIRFKELSTFPYVDDRNYPTKDKLADVLNVSLSFGNYLFAGMMYDNSACAASFMFNMAKFGYVVSLDKITYASSLLSLFFISPLNPLSAKFSKGEDFHSRTRIIDLKEDTDTDYGEEKVIGYYSDFTKNFIRSDLSGNRKTFFNKIGKFISDNITLITFKKDLTHNWILIPSNHEMQKNLRNDYKIHFSYEDKILNMTD